MIYKMKAISNIQYITRSKTEISILDEVKTVLKSGINWVQLRVKDDSLDILSIAQQVKRLTDEHQATLIINDRVALAKQINADGVHVGLNDMPIDEVRKILGDHKIIGGTANTLADAKNVELLGGDYVGLGPYRHTTTKQKLSPILGIDGFKSIIPKKDTYGWDILNFNIPIIAIGGLQLDDIKLLKQQTGIYGIALSGLIYRSINRKNLVKKIRYLVTNNII